MICEIEECSMAPIYTSKLINNIHKLTIIIIIIIIRKVLAYCIVHLIKEELNNFKNYWNTHKLRHNRQSCLPSGIPNDLFDMPEFYGM